jgi:DNA-binding response OmpR family regulator
VRVVGRGDQAIPAVREYRPQLVVLDVVLPGRSGLDVVRELRAAGDRVPSYADGQGRGRRPGRRARAGADDYLAKPFALRELLARVRALDAPRAGRRRKSRRSQRGERSLRSPRHDRHLARGARSTSRRTTFLVFKVLAARRGEVVPRVDIVEEVCGLESEATLRKVDNHVMALRRSLGDDPRRPRWIHTVRGHGYRLARTDDD